MNVEEFKKRIEEYFAECEKKEIFPDEAGLLLHLKISREKFEQYKRSNGAYHKALAAAALRRESLLTREIYSTTKSAAGKIFLARSLMAQSGTRAVEAAGGAVFDVSVEGDETLLE